MSFHAPNISKNLLEAVAAVMVEGAAGRMLAKSPTAKKDMEDAGESTMTYRGKDEKGVYTVKKHRAKGQSEYKEVGQRVYEDVEDLQELSTTTLQKYTHKVEKSDRPNSPASDRRIEMYKKAKDKLAKKPNTPVKEDVEQVAEGAFSDIDIDQKETKADPKRKAEYTKDFNELLAKHKDAGLDPSQRKRLRRLATILGKKLPGE